MNKKILLISIFISTNYLFANVNLKGGDNLIEKFDSIIKEKKKQEKIYSVDLNQYKILDLRKETVNYYYNFMTDLYELGNLVAAQRDYLNIRAITNTNLIDKNTGQFVIDMNYPYYYFISNLFWLEQGLSDLSFNDLDVLDLKPNLYALKVKNYPYFVQNLYLMLRNLYFLKINGLTEKYNKFMKLYKPILFKAGINDFLTKINTPAFKGTLSDAELNFLQYYASLITLLKKELFVDSKNSRIINSNYSTIHMTLNKQYETFNEVIKNTFDKQDIGYNLKINNKVFNFIIDYDYILYSNNSQKSKKTLAFIGKFLNKYSNLLGDSHFLNAKLFFISGLNFLKLHKYDKAIRAFKLSKAFYEKYYPFYKDLFIIKVDLYIADTLRFKGKFTESIKYYNNIIKKIEQKLKNDNLDSFVKNIYHKFLVQTYINVGNYYYDLGNKLMTEEERKKDQYFDNLIPVSIQEQLKYKEKALKIFEKALQVRKNIIKKEKDALYNIDEDPYIIMIKNNIEYIKSDIESTKNSY